MEIKVNGETRQVEGEPTVGDLLKQLGIDGPYLVVEHNGEFLAEEALAGVTVKAGDTLEIVRFVGGG